MIKRAFPAFLIMGTLAAACVSSSIIWMGNHSFPSTRWAEGETVVFNPDTLSLLDSTITSCKGIIGIRYAETAAVEEIPIEVEIESPAEGLYRCDTIYARLLPGKERTANHGKMGIFETVDTISLHSNVTPGWSATMRQILNKDIDGIISLTFEIVK